MNYEIVELEKKIIVGVSAKTGNQDPKMKKIIQDIWEKLFQGEVYPAIKNKVNECTIGLYSDYSESSYLVTAGAEVSEAVNPELTTKEIPAGKYAKFMLEGNINKIISEGWEEIWKTDLNRTFTGDFEEYRNQDMLNAKIAIYIAIK